jgi:inner membrane protein
MKWSNHILIAGAFQTLINPVLVPIAVVGSTAPDWLEYISAALGHKLRHRGPTHYAAYWFSAVVFFILGYDYLGIGLAFSTGGFSHVLADSFTVAGVPVSPISDRRFHLFGGRLRTGEPGEYIATFAIVICCCFIYLQTKPISGFIPFFPDWAKRYNEGTASAYEYRVNRFRFF